MASLGTYTNGTLLSEPPRLSHLTAHYDGKIVDVNGNGVCGGVCVWGGGVCWGFTHLGSLPLPLPWSGPAEGRTTALASATAAPGSELSRRLWRTVKSSAPQSAAINPHLASVKSRLVKSKPDSLRNWESYSKRKTEHQDRLEVSAPDQKLQNTH